MPTHNSNPSKKTGSEPSKPPKSKDWSKVYIGLGGNIGDVVSAMVEALGSLAHNEKTRVVGRSSLYGTPPWGDLNQDDFINACALLETTLDANELLIALKNQEKALKRETTQRWGPRTIDLDILIFENVEISTSTLEIPHPRMTERGFVLMPLNDLNSEIMLKDKPISYWLNETDVTGIKKLEDQSGWISG